MKFSSDKATHNHSLATGGRLRAAGAALAFVLMPIVLAPSSALSQSVQLVKVDVSVVGKGLRTSKLLGQSVVNDKGERVGSLDDIVVGDDHSLYAVLQVGGFLGLGSHRVAVPYDSLKIDQQDGKVQKVELPGASADQLKKLAEFRYS
jgi:sporulation protein YlmC with PRC-barrel domain